VDTDTVKRQLTERGVRGVEAYCAKLRWNASNPEVLGDLWSEAAAAMMFSIAGFSVEMRDRPDLWLTGFGQSVAAEVKHFRYKDQDSIDDVVLRNYGDYLVEYGDTRPTEGYAAWDQVVNVARRKVSQFNGVTPYLLVIQSSSPHGIDDVVVRTAANILNEEASADSAAAVARLSGLVFLSPESPISDGRNVYFFESVASQQPLHTPLREALNGIRRWSQWGCTSRLTSA
jgi:hypothetical protein